MVEHGHEELGQGVEARADAREHGELVALVVPEVPGERPGGDHGQVPVLHLARDGGGGVVAARTWNERRKKRMN